MNPETRNCQSCARDFIIETDDFSYYAKIGVLAPKMCPICRAQLRNSFRNERSFYKRECDKCHKNVVSMYSPNKPYTVWCYDCWFADDWDGRDYARDYDLSRPFFEQFAELWNAVPKIALVHMRSVNCEYINIAADNKNCYMIIESSNNEDCTNCYWIQLSKDLVDCSFTQKVERSYESDDCYDSYGLKYCKGCHSCTDSSFLFDCRGCMDCLGCANLRQKQYCIFNEQYTKEEYEKKLAEFRLDTHSGVQAFRQAFAQFMEAQPRKFAEITQAPYSTGNYLNNVKNVHHVFHSYDAEDCRYCVHAWRVSKDNMDCDTTGRNSEGNYQCVNVGLNVAHNIACALAWESSFLRYSSLMFGSQYCFGSTGLRSKKYCILNKEYSPEEYEILSGKIIESMNAEGVYGDFFPADVSCFGYNEACIQEHVPLIKEDALAHGFKWEDTVRGTYGKATIAWHDVPDAIGDTHGEITKEIFECTECQKNYRIIGNEFSFYQKLGIPLPRTCPECRHAARIAARGPNRLWSRTCMCRKEGHGHEFKCTNEFETSYSPDRTEILYCEECYQKEVV